MSEGTLELIRTDSKPIGGRDKLFTYEFQVRSREVMPGAYWGACVRWVMDEMVYPTIEGLGYTDICAPEDGDVEFKAHADGMGIEITYRVRAARPAPIIVR